MGLFIGLVLIALCVAIVWISRVLARWFKRPWLRYLFYFIGFAIFFGDIPLTYLQLNYLCHWQNIDEKIDNTKPLDVFVFNRGPGCDEKCQMALIKYKIKTVEIPVKQPDPKLWADQEGWHHFYLSHKGDPNCKLFKENPELAKGYTLSPDICIASQVVTGEPIAATWYTISDQETSGTLIFPYVKRQVFRKETATGETISIHRTFLLESGSWFGQFLNEFGSGGSRVSCNGPTIRRYPELLTSKEGD